MDSSMLLGAEGHACSVMAPDGQFNLGCRELNLYPHFKPCVVIRTFSTMQRIHPVLKQDQIHLTELPLKKSLVAAT